MYELQTQKMRTGAERRALSLVAASGKELFAIQLALQARNQQAALRRRGLAIPEEAFEAPTPRLHDPDVLARRPRPPAPSALARKPIAPVSLAAFLERLQPKAEYLELTA